MKVWTNLEVTSDDAELGGDLEPPPVPGEAILYGNAPEKSSRVLVGSTSEFKLSADVVPCRL